MAKGDIAGRVRGFRHCLIGIRQVVSRPIFTRGHHLDTLALEEQRGLFARPGHPDRDLPIEYVGQKVSTHLGPPALTDSRWLTLSFVEGVPADEVFQVGTGAHQRGGHVEISTAIGQGDRQ